MKKEMSKAKKRESFKLFLMIVPFLILVFLFSYFPLHGWIYALYDYRAPLKLSQCEFVGLKWFKSLFSNPTQVSQLLIVLKNTFAMSLLGIATSFLPVLFAVFLNEVKCKPFKNAVQTLTTIPSLMPTYFVMLMLSVANFLNNGMDQYYVFQNSFNRESIQVLDLYVYNIGMTGRSMSLATAVGIMKSLVRVTKVSTNVHPQ